MDLNDKLFVQKDTDDDRTKRNNRGRFDNARDLARSAIISALQSDRQLLLDL